MVQRSAVMIRSCAAACLGLLAATLTACSSGSVDALSSGGTARLQDPGYSLKDAVITETNNAGQPRYTVRAAQAEQDPASGEIALRTIDMQLRDQRGSQWHMQATTGRMPEDASMVALRGAVVVNGNLSEGSSGAVEMRTDSLDVDTRTEKASTRARVTIAMSGRELAARGMKADLKDRRVQLESEVHGRFTP